MSGLAGALPVLLPLAAAVALLALGRARPGAVGTASIVAAVAELAAAITLLASTGPAGAVPHLAGDWPAPWGIVLLADAASGAFLAVTAVLVLATAIVCRDATRRGPWFHPALHVTAMGLAGAFLTADLFNLFVWFEVLLIGSYALLLDGGGEARLRAGFDYLAINLVGSALFLLAVSLLYGVTGTLNLADLASRAHTLDADGLALAEAGVLLLVVVFALKAGAAPLGLWLPRTYAAAAAPVAALFAIMTKVGIAAVLRVHVVALGDGPLGVEALTGPWLLGAGVATLLAAAAAAIAATRLRDLASAQMLASSGTLLVCLGTGTEAALAAALYYFVHGTLASAALVHAMDLASEHRGGDALAAGGPPCDATSAALFGLAALTLIGLPPFSGFVGKVAVLVAVDDPAWRAVVWGALLGGTFVHFLTLARAWTHYAWGGSRHGHAAARGPRLLATAALLGAGLVLAVGAGPLLGQAGTAAHALLAAGLREAEVAALPARLPAGEPAP